MRKSGGTYAPLIITGALLYGMAVVEGREPYHIEQRQFEQPSQLTYEIANSTVTITILHNYFDSDLEVGGQRRVILVSISESQPIVESGAVEE